MPLLGPDQPLPRPPRRVLVAGSSGAGKSTYAARVGEQLGLPWTELDGLYHGPGWTPRESFVEEVTAVAAGERWVMEWQYRSVRRLLLRRTDVLVWVDPPRWRQLWQVVRRTALRRWRRQELWNGNREQALWRIFVDDTHIIRWAWRDHARSRTRMEQVLREAPELPVVRLRTRREQRDWLARLSGCGTPARPR